MRKFAIALSTVLCLLLTVAYVYPQTTNPGTFRAPTVKTGAVTTSVYWTAGTINNGGKAVAVSAGSAALGATKTDCTPPGFSACNILYADSTGTVAITTSAYTASAVGNTIMAYIETSAASVPTNIVLPQQSNMVWNATAAPQVGYTSASATPGTIRVIRGEITTNSTMTSGNLVGVRGAVTMATGSTISGSYLYGMQGKFITGTGSITGTASAAVYAQYDMTGGTVGAGNHAAVQANFVGVSSGSQALDGVYVENAGGGEINSYLRGEGNAEFVLDFNNTHAVSTTCQPGNISTTGAIKINANGTTKYIPLVAAGTCPF